jgi:uncharacterized protein YqgV (UPF0045/DUF77 family)
MVTAEFSVVGESAQAKRQEDLVKLALQPVRRRGLCYEVEPLSTTISGSIEDVFAAVQEAHELLVAAGVDRLVTTLRVEDKRGGTSMADKLEGFRDADLATHDALEMGS